MFKKPKRKLYALIFLLPTFLAFCVGFIYPFLRGIYLSFFKFQIVTKTTFVGINNYLKAFSDKSFLQSFWFTLGFVIVSVILINVLAFFIAYALTLKIKGSNIFRTVFFMPNLIGGIILRSIDMPSLVTNSDLGFWGLIILMTWQQAGYMMIIYIAGFQSVPHDLYEASKIDGASKTQMLVKVTLPMMMPSITICTFLTLTNSFKLFDQNLALTGGAPLVDGVWTTRMMALNIYKTFYGEGVSAKGVGQAEGVIFFLIVVLISLLQLYSTRRKEVQA